MLTVPPSRHRPRPAGAGGRTAPSRGRRRSGPGPPPRGRSTRVRRSPRRPPPPDAGRPPARTTCTTRSRAPAIWLRTAARGTPASPSSAIVSTRRSASAGPLAWQVERHPPWPVFMACSMSSASASADLADDDAVGPHAQGGPHQGADAHRRQPVGRRRPGLEPHDVVARQPQLGRVLDGHDALRPGQQPAQGVEQRGLPGAGAAGDDDVAARRPWPRPAARPPSGPQNSARGTAVAPNRRMVTVGPSTASGGSTTWTREPSGRRASTTGVARSARRPERGDDPLDEQVDRRPRQADVGALEPAGPFDPHRAGTVDEDVADLRRRRAAARSGPARRCGPARARRRHRRRPRRAAAPRPGPGRRGRRRRAAGRPCDRSTRWCTRASMVGRSGRGARAGAASEGGDRRADRRRPAGPPAGRAATSATTGASAAAADVVARTARGPARSRGRHRTGAPGPGGPAAERRSRNG